MRALTRTQAGIIALAVVLVVAIVAGLYFGGVFAPPATTTPPITTASPVTSPTSPPATTTSPTVAPSPTAPPTTTPPTTTPQTTTPSALVIGGISIPVNSSFLQFVSACKSGAIPAGSITIYFGAALSSDEKPAFDDLIRKFEQEYPCISVKFTNYADMNTLKTTVVAAVATGQVGAGPDVFTWAHDWIGAFADKGYIVPLESLIGANATAVIRSALIPPAASAVMYKLNTYGIPYAGEAIALIVNTKMVPTFPQTFDDMKRIMQQFYNPSNDTFGLAYQVDPYHIYPWVTAFGGYYYDQTTDSVGVNSTGTKEGIKFFIANVLPYLDYRDLGAPYQPNLFFNGRAPMIITGPWNIAGINASIGLSNVIVGPIPPIIINGTKYVPKPFSGFRNLYITSLATAGDPRRAQAAALFVMWMGLNDDAIKELMARNGYVPVKASVLQYLEQNKDKYPIIYGFAQAVLTSTPMPNSPKMDVVWNIGTYLNAIINAYTSALSQGKSQADAIRAALDIVDQQLDQAYASIMQQLSSS
ncbi:MAG: extracellular solute-binding protein [Desulfurococcaceae archaeon]